MTETESKETKEVSDQQEQKDGHDDLRVIESWGPYPIQPVIVRNGVDDALRSRLGAALLQVDGLEPFGFARFAPVTPADYE